MTRSTGLWDSAHYRLLGAGWAIGIFLVLAGWWGTAGEALLRDQLAWAGLAAAGLLAVGWANVSYLQAGRRELQRRSREILLPPGDVGFDEIQLEPVAAASTTNGLRPVAASQMRYFHRPDCPLVTGKAVTAAPAATHVKAGRTACAVCMP